MNFKKINRVVNSKYWEIENTTDEMVKVLEELLENMVKITDFIKEHLK